MWECATSTPQQSQLTVVNSDTTIIQANTTNLTETLYKFSQNNGDMDQSLEENETVGAKVGAAMFIIMPSVSDCDLPHTELAKFNFSQQ